MKVNYLRKLAGDNNFGGGLVCSLSVDGMEVLARYEYSRMFDTHWVKIQTGRQDDSPNPIKPSGGEFSRMLEDEEMKSASSPQELIMKYARKEADSYLKKKKWKEHKESQGESLTLFN